MGEKPNIPGGTIASRQKIIIEGFGLGALTTFAYKGTIPALSSRPNQPVRNDYNLPGNAQDQPIGTSVLGTAIWDTLILANQKNFNYTDPITGLTVNVPTLQIDTVLITINRPTNIISTAVQGQDGAVNEYIAKGNWEINIKGGLFGLINQRPIDDIAYLDQIESAKIDIPVWSKLFSEHKITNIVFKKINYPQSEGSYSFQLFEIEAISDIPFVIASTGTQIANANNGQTIV